MSPSSACLRDSVHARLHIVAGTLKAKLPGGDWKSYGKGQFFIVPPNVKFDVEAAGDVAYLCYYKR